MMPGDIVGVNDPGGGHGSMKQGCDGGLSASAPAIDGQNPRSAFTSSVSLEKQTDEVTDRRYSPWTGPRLPRAKLHVHVEIFCLSACRKAKLTPLWAFTSYCGFPTNRIVDPDTPG
jgi:hypothetical protein